MLEYENSTEIQASLGIGGSKNKSGEPSYFNNRKPYEDTNFSV